MKNLCIIPARGGSKRIPRKNIKDFCGRPAISIAIELALKSNLFYKVIVSTDDLEVSELSKAAGAFVPFLRPIELSGDYTTTLEVIKYVIKNLGPEKDEVEFICCLYPVTPLLCSKDLSNSYNKISNLKSNSSFCIGITEFSSELERALIVDKDLGLKQIDPSQEFVRSQNLNKHYYDAGQFYWGHIKAWENNTSLRHNSIGYILEKWSVIDINSQEDWAFAEKLVRIEKEKLK